MRAAVLVILDLTLGRRFPIWKSPLVTTAKTTCHLARNILGFWLLFIDCRFLVAFFLEVLRHFSLHSLTTWLRLFFHFCFSDPDIHHTKASLCNTGLPILARMDHPWLSLTEYSLSHVLWGLQMCGSFFWFTNWKWGAPAASSSGSPDLPHPECDLSWLCLAVPLFSLQLYLPAFLPT